MSSKLPPPSKLKTPTRSVTAIPRLSTSTTPTTPTTPSPAPPAEEVVESPAPVTPPSEGPKLVRRVVKKTVSTLKSPSTTSTSTATSRSTLPHLSSRTPLRHAETSPSLLGRPAVSTTASASRLSGIPKTPTPLTSTASVSRLAHPAKVDSPSANRSAPIRSVFAPLLTLPQVSLHEPGKLSAKQSDGQPCRQPQHLARTSLTPPDPQAMPRSTRTTAGTRAGPRRPSEPLCCGWASGH